MIDENKLKAKQGPLYVALYEELKENIQTGSLKKGDKVPSIRSMAEDLSVSKTTVQAAYDQLVAEGYLVSREKSGYYVFAPKKVGGLASAFEYEEPQAPAANMLFSTDTIAPEQVDEKRWRSLVREVLSSKEVLTSYGNPQGEYALRKELAAYISTSRAIQTTPEQIVIGAGMGVLLTMLSGLLRGMGTTEMYMSTDGFPVAQQALEDCGMAVGFLPTGEEGALFQTLEAKKPKAMLLTPTQAGKGKVPMPLGQKVKLLDYAQRENCYIIEDDFNGELRFLSRPIPAMKSIDHGDKVVYMGSFSKLLLPSVRIRYMILPKGLAQAYWEKREHYNQTASKVEQLALSAYLKDGSMQKHLRRLRKIYERKGKLLYQAVRSHFPKAQVHLQESALQVLLIQKSGKTGAQIQQAAMEKGVEIRNKPYEENGYLHIPLSFSSISEHQIEQAVALLAQAIHSEE